MYSKVILVLGLLLCISGSDACGRRRRCRPSRPPDRTPPSLLCPPDIDTIADKFQTHALLTWDESAIVVTDDRTTSAMRVTRCGQRPNTRFTSTTVTYYAYDGAGNKGSCTMTITVTVVYCPEPQRIADGYYYFYPALDFRYGGILNFGCYQGYNLVGDGTHECLQHGGVGYWSHSTPYCERKQCFPFLTSIPNGDVSCTNFNRYQSKCTYTCDAGYRVRQGQSRVRACSYQGTWLGTEPTCEDKEAPIFYTCPRSMLVYTTRNNDQASPTWLRPTARDNSGETIQVELEQGIEPYEWLSVGTHQIIYTASDSMGNVARPCIFDVIVRRAMCYTLYPTPYLQISCPNGYGYGESCTFACDTGKSLIGSDEMACEFMHPFSFWDNSMPSCRGERCSALNVPQNGALACDKWLYGEYCKMFCESTYDVPRTRAVIGKSMFVCSSAGQWNHNTVPDCTRTRRGSTYAMTILHHYFTGDCCDVTVQAQISEQYISILSTSVFSAACSRYPGQCSVGNVDVYCGTSNECQQNRKKRSMDLVIQGQVTFEDASELEFEQISSLLNETANSISQTLDNTTIENAGQFTGSTIGPVEIVCGPGLRPSYGTNGCVPCENGYNMTDTGDCVACPIGYYQDGTEPFDCKQCPSGTSTAFEATTNVTGCLDLCPAGKASPHGIETCTPCPVGSYSTDLGSTECMTCPNGTTTATENTVSINECRSYKLQMIPAENSTYDFEVNFTDLSSPIIATKILLTTIPETITPITLMNTDEETVSLNIMEHGVRLNFGSSCFYDYNVTLLEENWHLMLLYVEDPPVLYFSDNLLNHTHMDCSNMILQFQISNITLGSTEDTDMYAITDINVWNNGGDGLASIQSTVQSCGGDVFGDILAWSDIAYRYPDACSVPAECDMADQCSTNPCGDTQLHNCTDKVNNYQCICHDGFSGNNCEVNLDDCEVHACANNASCVDGIDTYTCQCVAGYRGDFCEVPIVNGNFTVWSEWSSCTQSCGTGLMTRHRLCNQPDPDGLPCVGSSNETTECNPDECPVCDELPLPSNAFKNCEYIPENDTTNCTVHCDAGFAFSIEPLDVYTCGFYSNYTWSANDADLTLPVCTEIQAASEVSAYHTVTYEDDPPCHPDSKQELIRLIDTNVNALPCIVSNKCYKASVDVQGCNDNPIAKRSTQTMSFSLKLSLAGLSSTETVSSEAVVTQFRDPAQALYDAAVILYTQVNSGNFTVYSNERIHYVASQNVEPYITCVNEGYTWADYYCIPCQYGYYENNYICEKCPVGSYQGENGKNSCTKCPLGYTTQKTGSTDSSACIATGELLWFLTLLILLLIGIMVVLAVIIYKKVKSCKKLKEVDAQETELCEAANSQPPLSSYMTPMKLRPKSSYPQPIQPAMDKYMQREVRPKITSDHSKFPFPMQPISSIKLPDMIQVFEANADLERKNQLDLIDLQGLTRPSSAVSKTSISDMNNEKIKNKGDMADIQN